MPTYDYECEACGHTFEKFQSIKARPVRKCPKCGKNKVRRLLGTGAGVIFKGSGFYQTDYKSPSRPDKPSGGDSGSAEGSGEGKSDSSGAKSDSSGSQDGSSGDS